MIVVTELIGMSNLSKKLMLQPEGGFLPLKAFEKVQLDDGIELNPKECLSASDIGILVETLVHLETVKDRQEFLLEELSNDEACPLKAYLSSGEIWNSNEDFYIERCKDWKAALRYRNEFICAQILKVKGLDDESINALSRIVSPLSHYADRDWMVKAINREPLDSETLFNIRAMVKRTLDFLETQGEIVGHHGSCSVPYNIEGTQIYGEFDFLLKDSLWDIKVLRGKITKEHTLQVYLYKFFLELTGFTKVVGKRFIDYSKTVEHIGLFNPRKNVGYKLALGSISQEVKDAIEEEIIDAINREYGEMKEGEQIDNETS